MSNVQLIYKQLRDAGVSEAGALGLMGNWMAESGLEPGRLQGDFTQGRTYSRAYTDDVASGRIGRSQFGRDQKGYGLAQWTYYTRKEDLYDFWNSSGKALDDVSMQVSFALQELSENGEYAGLWNVLKTTDDIWTAADKVCRLYERPYYNNVEAITTSTLFGKIKTNPFDWTFCSPIGLANRKWIWVVGIWIRIKIRK
jgi:hypothetical protein